MKAITLTNSKYQYMCSKSVKSFLRFNDLPIEIYFVGSEIENTCLKEYNCHYIKIENSKTPKEYKWYPEILEEKLKIFLLQKEDFLFFEPDVFFYKKLDFSIFKDGISGVREYAIPVKDYSIYLNAGFLIFKNILLNYNIKSFKKYYNSKFPDEFFLYDLYKNEINYIDYNICFLNGMKNLIKNPICVHCYGQFKPFLKNNNKNDFNKLKLYHIKKIIDLNL